MANLDVNAQRALAYLSGIPSTETATTLETPGDISDREYQQFQQLVSTWLGFQDEEIRQIGQTLIEVLKRLDLSSKKIRTRLESPQYLKIIRKSFRNWSTAESEIKRELMRNLLVNASVKRTSPDYVISLFIDWLDRYSDEHMLLIKELYKAGPSGLTRYDLWHRLHPLQPGEDTAEADLYRLLVLDLTTGHLIRQEREKDFHGNFLRTTPKRDTSTIPYTPASTTFDNTKSYILTELGKQFVVYTLEEHQEASDD